MKELKGACIIGQSGGPTSVINASAYGVIDTALKSPCITQVLGAEHGIKGVLNDRMQVMQSLVSPQFDFTPGASRARQRNVKDVAFHYCSSPNNPNCLGRSSSIPGNEAC